MNKQDEFFAQLRVLKTTRQLLKIEAAKRGVPIWELLERLTLDNTAPLDEADKTDRSRAARAR